MKTLPFSPLLILLACGDKEETTPVATDDTAAETPVDADGDGFSEETDCDDLDALVYPGADERCDGVDDDCDGAVDEDPTDAATWYTDADNDGYGDPAFSAEACDQPDGFVAEANDCDDLDALIYPGAEEACDGVDNDCDGAVDEDGPTWYPDADGDGHGDPDGTPISSCDQPSGYVADDTDCNDTQALAWTGAAEDCEDGIDQDCDGLMDCEDGDCAGELCGEMDCADGLDDDSDGAIDCLDDECWGLTACAGTAQVQIAGTHTARVTGMKSSTREWQFHVTLNDVAGQLQVRPSASASWQSCAWSVDQVSAAFHTSSAGGITRIMAVRRLGFYIDPGCGTSSSAFLPAGGALWADPFEPFPWRTTASSGFYVPTAWYEPTQTSVYRFSSGTVVWYYSGSSAHTMPLR